MRIPTLIGIDGLPVDDFASDLLKLKLNYEC